MKPILLCLFYGLILTRLIPTGVAQTSSVLEEAVYFSASIDGRAYRLEAVVFRPNDNERHPLVVMSHGRPGISDRLNDSAFITGPTPVCRALAAEGIAVVLFVRRGYLRSEGPNADLSGTAVETGLAVASEYRAAVAYWREQSFAIRDKVVLMGHSHSGWGVLAAAAVMMDSGGCLGSLICQVVLPIPSIGPKEG